MQVLKVGTVVTLKDTADLALRLRFEDKNALFSVKRYVGCNTPGGYSEYELDVSVDGVKQEPITALLINFNFDPDELEHI
ncbi:MAG TPA: hypothetical protein VEA59_05465 [Patescibacteria group bacterium]|nr:hypothetical protein [Patescibacteria group bacterium]